jgi:hypothetical protein
MIFRTASLRLAHDHEREARGPEDYEKCFGRTPAWNQVIIE